MSSSRKVSMGFGARKLPDKDMFSKSDPYLVISRPSTSGGFTILGKSEVKKNSLNPDWNDFYFLESELNGHDKDLNIKLEIFDDDGKKGPDSKDKLMCTGWFSLRQLEAAFISKAPMALSDGKSSKKAGNLVVRSYKEHVDNMAGPPSGTGQGYHESSRPQSGQQGYHSGGPGQGYPPSSRPQSGQQGYPPSSRPPSVQQGYPAMGAGQGMHQSSGPNNGQQGYHSGGQGQGYPTSSRPHSGQPGYPQTGAGQRPPSGQPGYPPSGAQQGYNHGPRGFPMGGNPGYPPSGQPSGNPQGYPAMNMNNPTMFPPSSLPEGPGGWSNPNH